MTFDHDFFDSGTLAEPFDRLAEHLPHVLKQKQGTWLKKDVASVL
jgi:hypothetical protein